MSLQRPRCLLITFQAPRMPGGGGEVRSYFLVRTAAEVFDLTVLNIGGMQGNGVVPDELRRLCSRVIEPVSEPELADTNAGRPKCRRAKWANFLLTLAMPWRSNYRYFLPLMLQHVGGSIASPGTAGILTRLAAAVWGSCCRIPPVTCFLFDRSWRKIRSSAIEIAEAKQFDVFWIEHTLAWPFAEQLLDCSGLRDAACICSGHNVEFVVSRRQAERESSSYGRRWQRLQARLMQRMETRAWRRSRVVLQCSEGDAMLTRSQAPGASVHCVPNGVDGRYFQPAIRPRLSAVPTLLFTAGFGYGPNSEAVEWFLRHVFPKIRRIVADVRLLLAGSEADGLHEALKKKGDISLDAVDWDSGPADIRPCFDRGWVYVVPLQCGGGSRLKILEAMSMRVPVVSTTVGAEGVPYIDGTHLLLADTPDDFVEQVVDLLRTPDRRAALTEAAAEFVKLNYDWAGICSRAKEILQREFA